jgi:hypothetical protein
MLMLMLMAVLAACGAGGPPRGAAAVDLTDFWRVRR